MTENEFILTIQMIYIAAGHAFVEPLILLSDHHNLEYIWYGEGDSVLLHSKTFFLQLNFFK